MNKWECTHPACETTAVGVGGAVGLRAVGWFFELGQPLLCPFHHPNRRSLVRFHGCTLSECGLCYAELQSKILQSVVNSVNLPD